MFGADRKQINPENEAVSFTDLFNRNRAGILKTEQQK